MFIGVKRIKAEENKRKGRQLAANKEARGEKVAAEELVMMESAAIETIKDKAPAKKTKMIA